MPTSKQRSRLNTTPRPSESDHEVPEVSSEASRPSVPVVNPNLSATLNADYEALQNDMEQARELAADFQRQLAGKSNEFAQLKQLFEKTAADLAHLQQGIVELRAERHRLANEAMRATAFQLKLNQVTGERDRLRVDLEFVRKALDQSADKMAETLRERDVEIGNLVIELVSVKEALAEARRELVKARSSQPAPKRAAPEQPRESNDLESNKAGDRPEEFIDISFGS